MSLVAAGLLRVLHFFYAIFLILYSHWKRLTWKPARPNPRIPKHLAVLIVAEPKPELEGHIITSVMNAVRWSKLYGVEKLTIYEEYGQVTELSQQLRECFNAAHIEEQPNHYVEDSLLPTPPPSEYSESRPISPHDDFFHDRNTITMNIPVKESGFSDGPLPNPLTVCICSRKSAKPNLAAAANSLLTRERARLLLSTNSQKAKFTLKVEDMDNMLESDNGLSPPDFMIIHPIEPATYNRTPFELHGYPPWQIRLTEIYFDRYRSYKRFSTSLFGLGKGPVALDETTFRRALDEFATAEMRFGK